MVDTVLKQWKDKEPFAIYFASMTINEAQQNYTTIEEELLALAYAIEKCLPYLLCSNVIGYTNHFTLKHLPD